MSKSILLADDSRSIRQIVSGALRTAGYEVIEAEDGQQGLQRAQERTFDLILTDLNMPMVDGLELTRGIRTLPQHSKTPILIVTTESQLSKKEDAKLAGASGWIVKPIQPKRLVEIVAQVIAKSEGCLHGN
jgi:two-component system chemotaxis response regulator CheY